MKTMNRVLTVAAVAAVIAVAAIGDASAVCVNARLFSTWNTDAGVYSYVNVPDGSDNTTIIGRFWQAGNRAAGNEGTYDDPIWLKVYPPSGRWYISGDMAGDGVSGCPNGDLIMILEDNRAGGAAYAAWRAAETPAAAQWWSFAEQGDKSFTPIPRPALSNRSPSGSSVTFNVTAPLPEQTGGTVITGFRLMQRRLPAQGNPGNSPSQYTAGQIIPPGGTAPLTIDCTAQDQVYLAFQIQYDGGQWFGDLTGPAVNVSCDPNLADPDREFKLIDKPGTKPRPTRER